MLFRSPRPTHPRRGVTLVEMLVTVALLVLMMSVIVQLFAAATTGVSAARTMQDLDGNLRQLDSTIRQDLANVTANFTPPLNPDDNLGYFEYTENSFADSQGEDADDCLRFTVNAPEGQIFTGRMMYPVNLQTPTAQQTAYILSALPITIQSQTAEVIYFLRNGNLYRRVLLIVPDRQLSGFQQSGPFYAGVFSGLNVGWFGVNDISARPAPNNGASPILLNTLGDLTNRENRFPSPRFGNDFLNNQTGAAGADGIPDDSNLDSVPDYWPTLNAYVVQNSPNSSQTSGFINEVVSSTSAALRPNASFQTLAFPYIYPYAYSQPDPSGYTGLGWIHSPDSTNAGLTALTLHTLNHAALDLGDSLPPPSGAQTWWGFPTWRETMSPNWNDPTVLVSSGSQPNGLTPFSAASGPGLANLNLLPPMEPPYRILPQLYNDGAGASTFAANLTLWNECWEDDLVMTGVRSFDVKGYDNTYPGYVDLGWGDDLRLYAPFGTIPSAPPFLNDNSAAQNGNTVSGYPLMFTWPLGGTTQWRLIGDTLAHEGRMPPVYKDYRLDPQWIDQLFESQTPPNYKLNELNPGLPQSASSSYNVGYNDTSTIRLRRVWDSWSTDYTQAPGSGVTSAGLRYGLAMGGAPVYPSYPPPYRAPLRGIQIQIRAVDPRNERVKVLTIRQDFSDKLGTPNP